MTQATQKTIAEWRVGRNFIRVGDVVKILPGGPGSGSRTSFEARVKSIVVDDAGDIRWVEVMGGKKGRYQFHAIRPERVRRVEQTRSSETEGTVRRERKR